MSAHPVYEIVCDCAGCAGCDLHQCNLGFASNCGYALTDYGNAGGVRAVARRQGWRTGLPGGQDRCPDCAAPGLGAT